jgi:hypothetical protein
MPNSRISQLPYVGNTGYTSTDIIPFVNYINPSGTTSNTTLLEHKSWILSGLSSSYLPLSGGTVSGGTSFISGLTASTLTNVNYIDFNLTANPSHQEGRIHWNDDTKTLEVDTENSNVHIEVGHENIVRVVNDTGAPLLKGTLVYVNGAQGGRPTVTKASYEGDNTSARTLGFVAANINNGSNGYVITYGILRDVNTLAYSAGTPIFLFTGGTYTNIRPIAPLHEVRLGYILNQNATTGSIFVNVMNGYELTELHDVSATTVNNLDILQWNSNQNVWQPTSNPRFNSISATTYQNLPLGSVATSGTSLYSTNPSTSNFNTTDSIYLGALAGTNATNTSYSNFLGNGAGRNATNASGSNFLGASAGFSATSASYSNFIGDGAGQLASSATNSNFLGSFAGQLASSASNSNFLGSLAGSNATSANNSNFFGFKAGSNATSANNSNFFGYQTGSGSTGSNNIIIGTNISLTGSNSINIGGVLFGTGTYNTTSGSPSLNAQSNGRIGVGVVTPTAKLHISPSTTSEALLRLEVGPAPSSPNDGDIWLESNTLTGLKIRISGVTRTITIT